MASNPIQDLLALGLRDFEHNTTAHVPKISWPIGLERALDLLSLASMLHRRLDAARVTPPPRPSTKLVVLDRRDDECDWKRIVVIQRHNWLSNRSDAACHTPPPGEPSMSFP
jgi:hypothetical protein